MYTRPEVTLSFELLVLLMYILSFFFFFDSLLRRYLNLFGDE